MMDIYILTPTKKVVALQVKCSDTVDYIKTLLLQKEHVPYDQQTLTFNATKLEDNDKKLSDYDIHPGASLELSLPADGYITLRIQDYEFDQQLIKLRGVKPYDTVENVKRLLQDRITCLPEPYSKNYPEFPRGQTIPPGKQVLKIPELGELEDDKPLSHYNVSTNADFFLFWEHKTEASAVEQE